MPITQDNRLLQLFTPLPVDVLLVNTLRAEEEISRLFRFELDIIHAEEDDGYVPFKVDIKDVLGNQMLVAMKQPDGQTERYFHGIVSQFTQGHRAGRATYYKAVVVPKMWYLTQRTQSRIFQQKSVPDILKEVFTGLEVTYEIQGTFHPRDYCVQYRETDFNFASRLMEEEGIYYYFEHNKNGHKMIVANTPQSHRECPSKKDIPYILNVTHEQGYITCIHSWKEEQVLKTGKYTLWDHTFELPHRHLETEKLSRFDVGGNQKLETYDYPGGYAKRFAGINKSGGEQASELQNIFEDNKRTSELREQEIDASLKVSMGDGNCSSMIVGHRFNLLNHPAQDTNGTYIVTSVSQKINQSPGYHDELDGGMFEGLTLEEELMKIEVYKNEFTCIRYGSGQPPYRPQSITPKPIVHGSQTAVVVGPAGEEIFTDKYGRVKVQFHWDREGRADSNASCWVRVAQNLSGTKWGSFYLPRIGQEVVVDFLEGDPDRPIIVGSVYNAAEMPPYTLPDEKTKTVLFKSYSSKGGGGFNELRIEDKKGSEQVFYHAEKNQDIRVKNDNFETILRDSHHIRGRDELTLVKGDKHLQVKGDQNIKVSGTASLNVTVDMQEKVGSKYALDAGMEVHIKAGTNLVLESGTSLTVKVGGNFININPGGIFIKGTMVFINSGGAAGSGAGSSPETPKDPTEADTANPGDRPKPLPASPPLQAVNYSPQAVLMMEASKCGAPFGEI